MGKVINLRTRRKQQAREDKAALAAQNRLRFGRSAAERDRDEQQRAQDERRMAQLRREPAAPADGDTNGEGT